MNPTNNIWWRDWQFLGALISGGLFWSVVYLTTRPVLQLSWPLAAPDRFLYPAIFYPVMEELVFRGFIQEMIGMRLRSGLGPVSYANVLTSALFCALHFLSHPPLWAAAVFFPSLVFGYFKDRSGRLSAPIALHVFYNSGYFWLFGAP